MFCDAFTDFQYLIFTNGVPPLLYYSHIPIALLSLLFGFFVFMNNKRALLNKILFAISILFSLWITADLIVWLNPNSQVIMFFWSLTGGIFALIGSFCVYFVYVFIKKQDITNFQKILLSATLLPIILATATSYNLNGFDISICGANESSFIIYYKFLYGIFIFLWILGIGIFNYKKTEKEIRKQVVLLLIGIEAFLLSFFTATFIASYLTSQGLISDSSLEQYGLFGAVIFIALLAYMIVKFKTFNIKLLGAQALIYSLIILISSQFFFIKTQINMILTVITVLVTIILGYYLIRGVKQEVAQREEIEKLAISLEKSNNKLVVLNEKLKELDGQKTEFVSLASHQLRSPLTAIKGYSSMILEGSFGKINDKAKEAIERVFESSQKLVLVIEDFLNITRIELGRMKYDVTEFNFNTLIENVIGEQKPNVERRGLTITYEEEAPEYKVFADMGKISQVISNLVDNSVKYCKEGSIKVKVVGVTDKGEGSLSASGRKVRLSITDTGVGIEHQVLPLLFKKFARATDASKTNIIGTGLGLFVAKQIIDAHPGGRIWAESEGKGKGSTFFVELALSTGTAPIMITTSDKVSDVAKPADPVVASPTSPSKPTIEPPISQSVAGDLS